MPRRSNDDQKIYISLPSQSLKSNGGMYQTSQSAVAKQNQG
jgi:hypothetical protein